MAIEALMVDVDGVLVDGRPDDGRPWQTSLEKDLGVPAATLGEQFFAPYWEDIVLGRVGLMDHLPAVLQTIAPHVSPAAFLAYWFDRDSRIVESFLPELAWARAAGVRVYLATNQEHLRAAHLMDSLGLAHHVDGIFYSARLGAKKPDPDFFAQVQAQVGLSGDKILLIDDSRENIAAALTAGWHALEWTAHNAPSLVRRAVLTPHH